MDSAEKKEGSEKLAPRNAVSSLVKTELIPCPHGPLIVTKPRKESTPLPGFGEKVAKKGRGSTLTDWARNPPLSTQKLLGLKLSALSEAGKDRSLES